MENLGSTLIATLLATLALLSLVWLISLIKRDASIIDPFWGAGFVLVSWIAWGLNRPASGRALWLAVLVTVWGTRLSLYLLWRNWGHGEDRRYQAMRNYWRDRFWWVSLFTVFWLQATLLWIVSLCVQVGIAGEPGSTLTVWDVFGGLLWLVGFAFEAVGDWQLARFKSDPANSRRVMDRGLWRLTRHPNYFGNFCVWWGLYLIAVAGGAWWTVFSPLVMSLLLLKVSGVTLLEKTIEERRPDYARYQARTNAFFPGPLKKQRANG